nr:MAG TPA: hypothetical protein [Caudoviricetes sp.]
MEEVERQKRRNRMEGLIIVLVLSFLFIGEVQ